MKSYAFPICFGELNGTPVGDLRLAVSDRGLIAVEWANSQLDFDSFFIRDGRRRRTLRRLEGDHLHAGLPRATGSVAA